MKTFKPHIDVRLPQKQKDELFGHLRKWSGYSFQTLTECISFLCKCERVIGCVYCDFYTTRIRILRCGKVYTRECVGYGCDEPFAILSVVEVES